MNCLIVRKKSISSKIKISKLRNKGFKVHWTISKSNSQRIKNLINCMKQKNKKRKSKELHQRIILKT